MYNASSFIRQVPLPAYTVHPVPPLLPPLSDLHLSLAVPIVIHWIFSGIFSFMETYGYGDKYKIHTSAEEETRNRCSRWECFRGVVINQIIQTVLGVGLGMLGDGDVAGKEEYDIALWARRLEATRCMLPGLLSVIGIDAEGLARNFAGSSMRLAALFVAGEELYTSPNLTVMDDRGTNQAKLRAWEITFAGIIYWYIVPAIQFATAIFAADTWQYFGHRWLHTNKWVYKKIHSIHHGLYVPYSYGAAFTHPLEGLFLDSIGTAIAFGVSGLSIRQGMWLYGYISFKAVTDHCGYILPYNPIRMFTENDAYFHDLHHQSWGLKSHFAVHFSFWDRMMGTYWADKRAADALYQRNRNTAERQMKSKSVVEEKAAPLVLASELTAKA